MKSKVSRVKSGVSPLFLALCSNQTLTPLFLPRFSLDVRLQLKSMSSRTSKKVELLRDMNEFFSRQVCL